MCYADPGSRCFTHGKEDFDRKEKAFIDATILAVRVGSPEMDEKAENAKAKMLEAETKMYASKEGLVVLKEKLDKEAADGQISSHYAHSEYQRVYNINADNMLAYDKINHTVNGRVPSKDWAPENINALSDDCQHRQRHMKLIEQMAKAGTLRPGDADKLVMLKAEQKVAWDRLSQAETTSRHLHRGILKVSETPPREGLPPVATAPHTKKMVDKPKVPSKPVVKHVPAEPKSEEYSKFTGGLYERSRTNQQVASATRQDLKKAVATRALPEEFDYKVTNRKNTIEINVIGKHDANIDSYEGAHGGNIIRLSETGRDMQKKVSDYANQYTYNHSNSQYDNYNQSHTVIVNFIDKATGKNARQS